MASLIDTIDANIISLLQDEGRMPNTDIARRLGMAEATVRKRIDRLRQEKVIRVAAWVDPLKIGYEIYVHIEIEVNPPNVEKVAESLTKLPEVFYVGICTGSFDILASAVFRSNEHMYEFLTRRLNRVPGLRRTSTSSVIRVVKRESPFPVAIRSEFDGDRSRRRVRSREVG